MITFVGLVRSGLAGAPEPYRSEHHGYISNFLTTGEKIIGIGRHLLGRR